MDKVELARRRREVIARERAERARLLRERSAERVVKNRVVKPTRTNPPVRPQPPIRTKPPVRPQPPTRVKPPPSRPQPPARVKPPPTRPPFRFIEDYKITLPPEPKYEKRPPIKFKRKITPPRRARKIFQKREYFEEVRPEVEEKEVEEKEGPLLVDLVGRFSGASDILHYTLPQYDLLSRRIRLMVKVRSDSEFRELKAARESLKMYHHLERVLLTSEAIVRGDRDGTPREIRDLESKLSTPEAQRCLTPVRSDRAARANLSGINSASGELEILNRVGEVLNRIASTAYGFEYNRDMRTLLYTYEVGDSNRAPPTGISLGNIDMLISFLQESLNNARDRGKLERGAYVGMNFRGSFFQHGDPEAVVDEAREEHFKRLALQSHGVKDESQLWPFDRPSPGFSWERLEGYKEVVDGKEVTRKGNFRRLPSVVDVTANGTFNKSFGIAEVHPVFGYKPSRKAKKAGQEVVLVGVPETGFRLYDENFQVTGEKWLRDRLKTLGESTAGHSNPMYRYDILINRIRVLIVRPPRGGCNVRANSKVVAGAKLLYPASSNNNCFFQCIKKELKWVGPDPSGRVPILTGKLTQGRCNGWRQLVSVKQNAPLTCYQGIELMKMLLPEFGIHISDCMSGQNIQHNMSAERRVFLVLQDGHYSRIDDREIAKNAPFKQRGYVNGKRETQIAKRGSGDRCSRCNLVEREGPHIVPGQPPLCNPDRVNTHRAGGYLNFSTKLRSGGYVYPTPSGNEHPYDEGRVDAPRFQKTTPREEWLLDRFVVHYDIETFTKIHKYDIEGNLRVFHVCIIGYVSPMLYAQTGKLEVQYCFKMDDFIAELNRMSEYFFDVDDILNEQGQLTHKEYSAKPETVEKLIHPSQKAQFKILCKQRAKADEEGTGYRSTKIDKIYLNAFNGSNFDHHPLLKAWLMQAVCPEKFCLQGSSIVTAHIGCFAMCDLCKMCTGSLESNLKAMRKAKSGVGTVKGSLDYDKLGPWDLMDEKDKEDTIKYLQSDVLGLMELYEWMNDACYKKDGLNLCTHISTSQLAMIKHCRILARTPCQNQEGEFLINAILLPTLKQEPHFRAAIKAGRCYPSKRGFKSLQYDQILGDELNFAEVSDYIVDTDVVSLYPAAMLRFEYPTGCCHETDVYRSDKLGIYEVLYLPNRRLQHAPFPSRSKTGLKWELRMPKTPEWCTSVEIEDARKLGYHFKVLRGYYWSSREFIFRNYVNEMWEDKVNSPKGTLAYELAKLFLNALYGKQIQRPIHTVEQFVQNNGQIWDFLRENDLTNFDAFSIGGMDVKKGGVRKSYNTIFLKGETTDSQIRESHINNPTHLGAFILAYSRSLTLSYMVKHNPHFSDGDKRSVLWDCYYKDTDSSVEHVDRGIEINKSIGGLDDDLGEGRIIQSFLIAPKLYMHLYIKLQSAVRKGLDEDALASLDKKIAQGKITPIRDFYVMQHIRGKGVDMSKLSREHFELMNKGEKVALYRDFSFKKTGANPGGAFKDYQPWDIIKCVGDPTKRTLNGTQWNGRYFFPDDHELAGSSVPWGHVMAPNKTVVKVSKRDGAVYNRGAEPSVREETEVDGMRLWSSTNRPILRGREPNGLHPRSPL